MLSQPLFQIFVETREGLLAVGPKASKELLEPSLMAINANISRSREKIWKSAHIAIATDLS